MEVHIQEIEKNLISHQILKGTPGPSGGFKSAQKCQVLVAEVHWSP